MNEFTRLRADDHEMRSRLTRWGSAFIQLMLPQQGARPQPDAGSRLLDAVVEGTDFSGEMYFGDICDLRACHITASRHTVVRRDGPLQPEVHDNRLFVLLQLRGEATFEQAGRRAVLRAGECAVYETARDFLAVNQGDVEQIMLLFPRDRLIPNRLAGHDSLGQRIDMTRGMGSVAADFARNSIRELPACSMSARRDIEETLARLFQRMLSEQASDVPADNRRFTLAYEIRKFVDSNLHNPELCIDDIAGALGYGKRNLHKAFSTEPDETIGSYMLKARLERCRNDLLALNPNIWTITDIALKWGFNSSAHFSTAFKNAYGVSPRDFRKSER